MHMAIVLGINKGIEFSRELTKEKSRNVKDFYCKVDMFLQLEVANAELEMMNAVEVGESSNTKPVKSGDNDTRGRRKKK